MSTTPCSPTPARSSSGSCTRPSAGSSATVWSAPDGEEPGHGPDRKRFVITEHGVTDLEQWIGEPELPEPFLQPTLFIKVVLALQSGRDAAGDPRRPARAATSSGCAS